MGKKKRMAWLVAMKKKRMAWLMAMVLAVISVPVSAAGEAGVQAEEVTLTEENWYDSVYFQQPERITAEPKPGVQKKQAREAGPSLEESVVSQLQGLPDRIDVADYKIPVSQAGTPYFQILSNHPELFYVEKSTSYSYSGGYIRSYSVKYRMAKEEIPRCREALEREVDLAAAQVDSSLSNVEKALAVHDYLALHCEYDYDRLQGSALPAVSHSAYGALVERMAVCDGYAGAFAYIMKSRFGVPCILVSSSGMAHAWNMILIDNQWYHVDVTWDDPVRDLIGRAGHSYFLVSDSVISDNSHKHYGWESEYQAASSAYDSAFWTGVDSAVIHHQGAWYYSKYDAARRKVNLMKRDNLLGGTEAVVYASDPWGTSTSYYPASYMYLDQANGKLYFSTRNDLRRLNQDGTAEAVYSPSVPANYGIYGFTVRGSQLCYAIQNTPSLNSRQTVQAYTLAELEEPPLLEITGVSAEDVQAVYDGEAKQISVKGTWDGDVVRYALEGQTTYRTSQPEMRDAGTYRVSYRVERSGYQAFMGTAAVTVAKAVPQYTAPSGLEASSGKTLASIALPEGFVWQTAADTKLSQEGTFSYLVKYMPSDAKNYQEVSDIRVKVTVSCPGHQYTSEVTKEPTAAEAGIRTFTCTLCGHSYTEEIEKLDPSLPAMEGIHARDVKKTYDGTPAAVEVEGLSEGDSVLYAGEDGVFGRQQPEMTDAGTYQVTYRVERRGFQSFEGSVQVVIEQAVPQYTAPTGLEGLIGETLSSVGLPDGFRWQSNAGQRFTEEGGFRYLVKYVPEDTRNFKEVSDIPVEVAVSCPGHSYRSAVTKSPTTVQKGIRTYTCSICGNTYTEEIAMLTPKKPGNVSGQKLSKATANSLTFTWKREGGVRYELALSQGKKKAGAKDTGSNSATFTKLKAGTDYSLKITPYRTIDGRKVYAAKSATVKAATAPAQVKLSSVRKGGNKKARIAWKKVPGASGYEIFMRMGNGKYKKIKTIANGKTASFLQSGLKKGKTYGFRARAYKKVGSIKVYGSYSGTKSIKIK